MATRNLADMGLNLQRIISRLQSNQNLLKLEDLWNSISKYCKNKKGINRFEMNKLLIEKGCSLSQYELDIIYNKLDYDNDQFIGYDDLTQEFVNYY